MATSPNLQTISPGATLAACDAIRQTEKKLQIESTQAHFHPLETIAFFRKWPRSFVRNFIYTLLFNALFATGFTLIAVFGLLTSGRQVLLSDVPVAFADYLLISNVIGFAFWGVIGAIERIEPFMRWVTQRGLFMTVLFYAFMGTFIVTGSFVVVSLIPGYSGIGKWLFTIPQLVSSFIISLIVSTVLGLLWQRRVNELAAQLILLAERERAESAQRAAVQANLRALQAQIEPHFLFNTLANVTSLIHTRPDAAKHMLEEFIAYLRVSLATTRENETTLAQEFVLMQRFLSVLKVRMGSRLQVRVELPVDLQSFVLPPMLIQPLVENAIKHGVEPKIDGGEIRLKAAKVGDAVAIEVADTGMGFQHSTSNGIGLKNVRERLDKLYEGKATLAIEDNVPSGTKITIRIPA
jgi:sensor histidine kinase YesM